MTCHRSASSLDDALHVLKGLLYLALGIGRSFLALRGVARDHRWQDEIAQRDDGGEGVAVSAQTRHLDNGSLRHIGKQSYRMVEAVYGTHPASTDLYPFQRLESV